MRARGAAAELLISFRAGHLTGWQLEDQWPHSSDAALRAIGDAVWPLYDDLHDTHFVPTPAADDLLVRCIDFLRTDAPYAWPTPNRWLVLASLPLAIITFGWSNKLLWRRYDFPHFWPFDSAENRAAHRVAESQDLRAGAR